MLNAEQMRMLPQCFTMISDPRRVHGIRCSAAHEGLTS